jgi:integrase/recombinase XerD
MASLSTDRPVTPLRQRMLDDMAARGLRKHTRRDYIRYVRRFAAFLGRLPDTATPDDMRRFQVHQTEAGATASINGSFNPYTGRGALKGLLRHGPIMCAMCSPPIS